MAAMQMPARGTGLPKGWNPTSSVQMALKRSLAAMPGISMDLLRVMPIATNDAIL